MTALALTDVRKTILESNGKIFKVVFVKRTTGEVREMVARIGVKKDQTGEGLKFDPLEKGLLTVFDMQKDAYRMINLDTVTELKCLGETYEVKQK